MIVYVVTSGSYSDYSIDQVFSTEDKAKDFIKFQAQASKKYREEQYQELLNWYNDRSLIPDWHKRTLCYSEEQWKKELYYLEQRAKATVESLLEDTEYNIEEYELDTEYVAE